jgi:hypothetical protein
LFGCGCLMMSSLWDLTFTACFSCHMVAWVGWWRLITFDVCYTNGLCFYICHQSDATLLIFAFQLATRSGVGLLIFASTFDIRGCYVLRYGSLLLHLTSEVTLRYGSLLRHLPS